MFPLDPTSPEEALLFDIAMMNGAELAAIYYALRDLPEEAQTEGGVSFMDWCRDVINEGVDNDDGGTYGTDVSGDYDLGDFYRDAPFDFDWE